MRARPFLVILILAAGCKEQPNITPLPDGPRSAAAPAAPAAPKPAAAADAAPVSAAVVPDAAREKAEDTGKPSGDRVGVAPCDDYLDKMSKCAAKLTPEAQAPMKQAMNDTRRAWQTNAQTPEGRKTLESICKQALDAAKSAAA